MSWSCSPPSPTPPRSSLLSYPPSPVFFLFISRRQDKIKTQNESQYKLKKYDKHNKMEQKSYTQKTWSLLCVVQPLLGSRPALEYGWHTQKHLVEENIFSLFLKCIIWGKVLGGGEHLCPFPLLLAGLWSDLNLVRTSAYFCSLCEFMCVSILLCLNGSFLEIIHQL